uniref:Putative transcriptional adaptor 1-2 n=1 Tax=Corethrella appendiculata TaxID=1370023 RepID=U5EZP9_9DIPT
MSSSTIYDPVLSAKQALAYALGDKFQKYLVNMKMWFRKKYSKEEFDSECRKLFTPDQMHLHNKFLLAILNKIDVALPPTTISEYNMSGNQCTSNNDNSYSSSDYGNNSYGKVNSGTGDFVGGSSGSSSKKRKRNSRSNTDCATFKPAEVQDYIPTEINYDNLINQNNMPTIRYAAQELFLPDLGLVMGRLMVAAWEVGLINIEESAAELIANSVQTLLKNILSEVIMKKKNYRTTADGNYFYDVGHPISHPFTRNSVTRQRVDDEPIELDKEITTVNLTRTVNNDLLFLSSCQELYPTPKNRITTYDVYKTLLNRKIIPSHSVYSMNIEKISSLLS